MPRIDGPLRGVLLALGAMLLFSSSDATSKVLASGGLPSVEIAWLRYVVFVLVAAPGAWRAGISSARPGAQLLRGTALVISSVAFIAGLRSLPLADATAMGFASPLFIVALAIPVLGERVGVRRWAAVIIGLAGVLIVVRPGTAAFRPAAILPVASAAAWAVAMVTTRRIAATERPATTLFWTAASGLLVLSVMLPWDFIWPTPRQLALGALLGLVASGGQWLVLLAYRHANASLLAPLSYSQLLWSTTYGVLLFGAVPDGWTLTGAAVIVGAGLAVAPEARRRPAG
jgi:drug/metabolite transporter (DMT)-like permease